jgi:hypothetical protein
MLFLLFLACKEAEQIPIDGFCEDEVSVTEIAYGLTDEQKEVSHVIEEEFNEMEIPSNISAAAIVNAIAESRLNHLFHYRHTIMKHDLSWLKWAQDQQVSPKKVIISGASGLVGKNLSAFLSTQGHDVWHFTRNPNEAQIPNRLLWQNAQDPLPSLASFDWVIHLAGENVGQRWTQETKKKIVESRLSRTQALAQKLAQEKTKNQVFFSASAIG